jgi:PAS domain S-box-containing protein
MGRGRITPMAKMRQGGSVEPSPDGVGRPTLAGNDLLAAAADWLWEAGADGAVSFLSPEFEASTGVSPQALRGRELCEGALPEGAAPARAAIAKRKPFRDLVLKIGRPDGRAAWIELAGTPLADADGRFAGYRGIGKTVTAEIGAHLALQKSERRFREFFEVASDWFWETDTENRNTFLSPNVETILGLPATSYLGKRLADTEGVALEPESAKATLAAFKARKPYRDFVYSRKLPSGRVVWIDLSGSPFYDEAGVFQGYRGVARDVTAQIEAEHALRASERRFRQLYEIGSDYYWEQDEKHRLVFVSPESVHDDLYGVPFAQLRGKRPTEFMNLSFDSETGRKLAGFIKARQPYRDIPFSVKHANGKTRWIAVSAAPVFDSKGEFRGYRGVGVEITARVEAEAIARLAQSQLHDAVTHVSQPFAVFDAESRAIAFNQAFADLYRTPTVNTPARNGVTFRELAEWQLKMGVYAAGADEQPVTLEALLDHFRSQAERAYHLSDDRWMMVVYRPLPGDGRVGLWTDITALKRAEAERRTLEAQLQHSQRLEALGTLAGGAAHEINNALVPVIALTKMVAGHLPEDSRDRRSLGTVLIGAERSRDLVKQILAFSRKESEEQRQESVDLAKVLREALSLMRATVATSIRFEEEIAAAPAVAGDANRLHQVIVNLVTNAAQAIGEAHGTITVGLRGDPDGSARFWVADTGCGMDEVTRARIFEPFFTTKAVGKGTGLGLAVVHGIIKEHQGRIEVDSAPGRGTRFDVVLPSRAAEAGAAA